MQGEQTETSPALPKQSKLAYLAAEDIRVAASLLFKAYQDDPMFRQIFKAEKDGYEQRLRAAIREELNTFWQHQQAMVGLYSADTLEGVVCMSHVQAQQGPSRLWHWRLRMLLTAGFVSTRQMLRKEQKIAEAVGFDDYLMLDFIAVHPRYQHKGLGHLLVQAAQSLLTAHPSAQAVVALATRPPYQTFLAHQHFEHIATIEVDGVGGQLMALSRQAMLAHTKPEED